MCNTNRGQQTMIRIYTPTQLNYLPLLADACDEQYTMWTSEGVRYELIKVTEEVATEIHITVNPDTAAVKAVQYGPEVGQVTEVDPALMNISKLLGL